MNKIMISAIGSGSGKTTVTAALLSLFQDAQPFKCGPDYIDPMFHEFVSHKNSYNLDLYMLGQKATRHLFYKHAPKDGISILEGMMGLYDGLGHQKDNYSAAHIARTLGVPVILVVDGKKISTSIAAIIKGYKEFDTRVNIRGVVINRVSESLYIHLKEAVELHTDIPCVGYLPEDDEIAISERHLGLMQAQEVDNLQDKIEKLRRIAKKTFDIEKIQEISKCNDRYELIENDYDVKDIFCGLKVGIAKDSAFSFYYKDNIELLEYTGIKIKYFSPLEDSKLPDVDCLYLGGGYPEIYAKKLSENTSMLNEICDFSKKGKFIYAECGGMMYLSSFIKTLDGTDFEMAGIFSHKVVMKNRLNIKRFGYVDCKTNDGDNVRAHEFHYSDVEGTNYQEDYYFDIQKPNKNKSWKCGFIKDNTIAGYPHIHFYSNIEFFKKLFSKASEKTG